MSQLCNVAANNPAILFHLHAYLCNGCLHSHMMENTDDFRILSHSLHARTNVRPTLRAAWFYSK